MLIAVLKSKFLFCLFRLFVVILRLSNFCLLNFFIYVVYGHRIYDGEVKPCEFIAVSFIVMLPHSYVAYGGADGGGGLMCGHRSQCALGALFCFDYRGMTRHVAGPPCARLKYFDAVLTTNTLRVCVCVVQGAPCTVASPITRL